MKLISNTLKEHYANPPGSKQNHVEEITGSLIVEFSPEEMFQFFWLDFDDVKDKILVLIRDFLPASISDVELEISAVQGSFQVEITIDSFESHECADDLEFDRS